MQVLCLALCSTPEKKLIMQVLCLTLCSRPEKKLIMQVLCLFLCSTPEKKVYNTTDVGKDNSTQECGLPSNNLKELIMSEHIMTLQEPGNIRQLPRNVGSHSRNWIGSCPVAKAVIQLAGLAPGPKKHVTGLLGLCRSKFTPKKNMKQRIATARSLTRFFFVSGCDAFLPQVLAQSLADTVTNEIFQHLQLRAQEVTLIRKLLWSLGVSNKDPVESWIIFI